MQSDFDVMVVGSGPAGLSAALTCDQNGVSVALIEREADLGGILKQCIHEGFGLHRHGRQLTGPEYIYEDIKACKKSMVAIFKSTFITDIIKNKATDLFEITLTNNKGIFRYTCKSLILATGCRERTAKQVSIYGTRPSGIMTAGTAQYYVNRLGYLPGKKCIILGSGDIGLIMARRLTLEGSQVDGVYETKHQPSGLNRNIVQCLEDFNIPLHLGKTIVEVRGSDRLKGVKVMATDEKMQVISGTEKWVACDALILSVGLLPENEMAKSLGMQMDYSTKGPVVNQWLETSVKGVFSCGNALHVNDLVDYVSESGNLAGFGAVKFIKKAQKKGRNIQVKASPSLSYVLPQKILVDGLMQDITFYFRVKNRIKGAVVEVKSKDQLIYKQSFIKVSPPEMESLTLKSQVLNELSLEGCQSLNFNVRSEQGGE